MDKSCLEIIKTGPLCQIQDNGRIGFQHLGISPGGFMDELSAYWANRLCGNRMEAATIETAFGALTLKALEPCIVAVTGAESVITVNGENREMWRGLKLYPGDVINIAPPTKGIWGYLAVSGGFAVGKVLGSVATNLKEKLGGTQGNGLPLKRGERLVANESSLNTCFELPRQHRPYLSNNAIIVNLIPCAHYGLFNTSEKRKLLSSEFTLGQDCSRMGYRFKSDSVTTMIKPGLASEAIDYGSVQLTPSGEAIVLLNERQTLGGYPKFGSVWRPDCWRLTQMKPGSKLRFQVMRLSVAQSKYKSFVSGLINLPLKSSENFF